MPKKWKMSLLTMNLYFVVGVSVLLYFFTEWKYTNQMDIMYARNRELGLDISDVSSEQWDCTLLNMHARMMPLIKQHDEYGRIIVSAFLHKSRYHLLSNVFFHWFFLLFVEDLYSTLTIMVTIYYGAFVSNMVSGWAMPDLASVGSSGIVFSLMGLGLVASLRVISSSYKGCASDPDAGILQKLLNWFSSITKIQSIHLMLLFVYALMVSYSLKESNDNTLHFFALAVGSIIGAYSTPQNCRSGSRLLFWFRTVTWLVLGSIPLLWLLWSTKIYILNQQESAMAEFNFGCFDMSPIFSHS